MRKSSYIFILFAVLSCAAFGQYRSETLRKADILYQNHKIYEAIDLYVEAISETPHLQEIVYKVASLYKSNFALVQAEKWYEEVLKFKKQDYVLAKFEYAIVLKQLGKYEKAIVNFEEFIKYYRGNDKSDLSKVVEKLITGCDRAMMSEKDDSFEVLNLSRANSIYSDLAPYLYQDTLYFSSIKTDTALTYIDDIGIKFQMSLQKTAFNLMEDTAKGNVMPFGPSLAIGDNSHVANATFTKDGQTMFFTKCITNLEFKNHCDLYGSKLKVGKWEAPIKLGPTVNDKTGLTSSTHPSVAAHRKKNKNVLYFSSNRIGGQGGYDLWTVDIDEKFVCSKAKNLGKKINTAEDEITPSYNEEKQILYFSSNGHIGFGGFDIYKVKKKGRKFNAPSALKGPFNTSSDELYFQNLGNNKYLLVSNRNGAKIYHKDCVLDDMFIIRKKQRKKYLIAKLYVKDSLLTEVDSSTLQMISIDSSTVIKTNVAIRVYPGKDYTLSTNINDFINDSKTVSITKTSPDTLLVQLTIEKVEEEKEIQLKNIYFAFNSAELNDNSKLEIDQLLTILNNNPKFKIELGAHTDDIGKDEANQSLSQDRAESVVNYLVSEGIRIERLVPKGYGESKPIAPNKNKDGSDNPEGRQLNRRIVFKIIGEVEVYQSSAPIQMIQTNDSAYTDTIVQEPELIDSPKDTIQKISNDTAVKTSTDSIFTKTAAAADLPNTVEKPDSINLTNKDTVLLPITKAPIILDDSLKNNHKVSTKTVVKNVLTSQPEDASAIKGKVRWLNRPAAQRISCKSTISIQSLRVMAKEKTGVTFKVRVVKASNGKTIHESEDFNLEPNKNVSAKLMKLFDVEINCKLEKGSYFIFPIVTKGSLAFMPRYTKENSFENGKIVVHKAMYTSYTTEKPIKYKFETKEEKKNTYVNYGPFLKMEFFDPSAPVQITE
ncbi:MAG: OOP family OmpA-OmpF porin, partial [Glaciecola sp.]